MIRQLSIVMFIASCAPERTNSEFADETCAGSIKNAYNNSVSVSVVKCEFSKFEISKSFDFPEKVRNRIQYCNFELIEKLKINADSLHPIPVAVFDDSVESRELFDVYSAARGRAYFDMNSGGGTCIEPHDNLDNRFCMEFMPQVIEDHEYVYFEGASNRSFFLFPLADRQTSYLYQCAISMIE